MMIAMMFGCMAMMIMMMMLMMFGCLDVWEREIASPKGSGVPEYPYQVIWLVIHDGYASWSSSQYHHHVYMYFLVHSVHYTCKLVSDRLAICCTLHYGIRWKLNRHSHQIPIWFCIIPPEAPVWKDFTLTEYRHVWKNLYWTISWPQKVCLHMASFADAVEKSYANYGLVLPYINLHLRLQQLM